MSKGWRADCFRTRMAEFDAAYRKAAASSRPDDWMEAALLAQQFRNVAYAVLTGEAPKQEPPAEMVIVPREPTMAQLKAGADAWLSDPCRRSSTLYRAMVEAALPASAIEGGTEP